MQTSSHKELEFLKVTLWQKIFSDWQICLTLNPSEMITLPNNDSKIL
jgi:hypothetical protein